MALAVQRLSFMVDTFTVCLDSCKHGHRQQIKCEWIYPHAFAHAPSLSLSFWQSYYLQAKNLRNQTSCYIFIRLTTKMPTLSAVGLTENICKNSKTAVDIKPEASTAHVTSLTAFFPYEDRYKMLSRQTNKWYREQIKCSCQDRAAELMIKNLSYHNIAILGS